jgi:DNA-binding response OmpR family regulator
MDQAASWNVLIVEDEYFIADDLAAAFTDAGINVVGPVSTLDEALGVVAEVRPDAAILDVNLRGQDVYALADRLSDLGVPFAFATGYARSALPGRHADAAHWEKPVNSDALAASVVSMLKQKQSAQASA